MSLRLISLCRCLLILLALSAVSPFSASADTSPRAQRERSQSLFRRLGFLGPHTPLVLCSVNRHPTAALDREVATRSSVRTNATGLTFQFLGFTSAQKADFESYRDL